MLNQHQSSFFNGVLLDQCSATGWNNPNADICTIITKKYGNLNLIKDFGRICMMEFIDHCLGHILNSSHQDQHQYQLYQCLIKSLKDSGRIKIFPKVQGTRLMILSVDLYFQISNGKSID